MRDLNRSNSICLPPEALLLESVKKNDIDTIKTLIQSNKSLLHYEYEFTSKNILLTACSENGVQAETIQTLIDLGSDLVGNSEWKPLHLAAENPDISILEVIVKRLPAGHINETVDGNTALHCIVKGRAVKDDEERFCQHVELLLKNGIDANKGDGKALSAIFWAAKNGYKKIVKALVEKSVGHLDLDSHKLRNTSARDLIIKNSLYDGLLPEAIFQQSLKEKLFGFIKHSKGEEFIDYVNTLSLTHPPDFNLDDGVSTLLQYSCEKGLTDVVRYLVDRETDTNKIGAANHKTPLELAAEKGYFEIVDILLDQQGISSNIFCYLLKHSDSPKIDKLIDHEECCKIILKKFEANKAILNINAVDELGNTPLHYALRYSCEEIVEKLLQLGASLASKNEFGVMPIKDIKPELLGRHLDGCIHYNLNSKNDDKREFEVTIDYTTLVPPRELRPGKFDESDPESFESCHMRPETEVIDYMSEAPEFRDLLKHPVIVSFLFMKWHRIRSLFYSNLLFYIVFVASLVSYIFAYYVNFDVKISDSLLGFGNFSCVILNITFWVLVLRELFQIVVSSIHYFKNFENFVEIILIVITGMILYIDDPTHDTRKQLASVAILLAAFELVLMVGQHPKLSTNVVMLKTVSVNFFKLLLWYSLLIIAFALSFYILFTKTEIPQNNNQTEADEDLFMGPGKSLFKTIVMLTGEFDAGSINFQTYPITSKLIFSLFVFMITIILLNLLNGLAVSDTQSIKNNAELVGHIARAQHIYYVESMLLGNILPTSLMKAAQRLFCCFPCDRNTTYLLLKPLGRRICLFSDSSNCSLTVLPNNYGRIFLDEHYSAKRQSKLSSGCWGCSDLYLDKETIRRIVMIVKERRKAHDVFSSNNIRQLQEEMIQLNTKLDLIIKSALQPNSK